MKPETTSVYVEFMNYNDELQADNPDICKGPYPFVQVTYEYLRHGEDGNDLAWLIDGYWVVEGEPDKVYSDFVVSTQPC